MNPTPLVTVLINNYNYGRFIGQAIESALDQTYPNLEIIVVDDGSTDDSRNVISRYEGRVRAIFKENGGQASAFNAGFAASAGEIVCFLDADDVFRPAKAACIVEAFQSNPTCSWVFHPLEVFCNNSGVTTAILPSNIADGVQDHRSARRSGSLKALAPATSGIAFTREALSKLLPMPEDIRIVSDNYLKMVAMSKFVGMMLKTPLSRQRIHGSNAYTDSIRLRSIRAPIHLRIANGMRLRHPELWLLADRIFARNLSDILRLEKGLGANSLVVNEYLSSISVGRRVMIMSASAAHMARLVCSRTRLRVNANGSK